MLHMISFVSITGLLNELHTLATCSPHEFFLM